MTHNHPSSASRFRVTRSRRGAPVLEYVVIVVGIGIFCVLAILLMGKAAQRKMNESTQVVAGTGGRADDSGPGGGTASAGSAVAGGAGSSSGSNASLGGGGQSASQSGGRAGAASSGGGAAGSGSGGGRGHGGDSAAGSASGSRAGRSGDGSGTGSGGGSGRPGVVVGVHQGSEGSAPPVPAGEVQAQRQKPLLFYFVVTLAGVIFVGSAIFLIKEKR